MFEQDSALAHQTC